MRIPALAAVSLWGLLLIPAAGAQAPAPAVDPERFAADIAAFEAEDRATPPPAAPVLFVGSSSIRYWDVAAAFPGWPTLRRGYGGSHLSDTIHFVDRLIVRYAPSLVVFYAGDADVAAGKDAATIARDTLALVTIVHARLPETPVVVIGTKPSPLHWPHMATIRASNQRIRAALARDRRAAYTDAEAALLGPDGRPRPECYAANQLNLNAQGYAAWTAAVRPTIARLARRR